MFGQQKLRRQGLATVEGTAGTECGGFECCCPSLNDTGTTMDNVILGDNSYMDETVMPLTHAVVSLNDPANNRLTLRHPCYCGTAL